MDPLSIVAGTAGILDICVRLAKYLNDVKEGAERVDEDIEALYQQVAAIGVVIQSIQNVFKADLTHTGNGQHDNIQALWEEVDSNITSCQAALDKLFILISQIVGKETSKQSKLEGFRRYLRKQSTEDEFNGIRTQLGGYHHALQTLLTSVNIVLTKRVQSTSDRSFTQISADIAELRASLKVQISSLQASSDLTHSKTLTLAAQVLPAASPNEHFYAQPVSSIFTGRKIELEKLKLALLAPPDQDGVHVQRRFVVFGLGGSGKTQFCSKFAQENRQSFWGVFWIDASSDATAKESFISIAKIAGKHPPSDLAGKNWLSNTRSPWLLIIDNADKLVRPLDSYFPQGERGCILITTRNFELAQQGTCGDRYYHFSSLEEDEANTLFLKAAEKPSPWTVLVNELAAKITKHLGFLPLALVYAGRAILGGVRMEDYLSSYDRHWDRVRRERIESKKKPKDNNYTVIYSTYEILYQGLEERRAQDIVAEDAVYILKLFSFFHRENIRYDMLLQAASNPRIEQIAEAESSTKTSNRNTKSKQWNQTLRDALIELYTILAKLGEKPVLSDLLIWKGFSEPFDDSRLRDALQELQRMSLVNRNPEKDSYSMHPVVHQWIRKRAEMSLGEQAVFCHAAATVLTQAILLPPHALSEKDEDFRRDLAAHVDHVQGWQRKNRDRMLLSQKSRRWKGFPVLQPQLDRPKCLQLGKFSYVYVQCSRFKEASELQRRVFDFLNRTFGMEHESTLRIAPHLAAVLRHLDRVEEAAELQERILQACMALWEDDDPQVLEATSALGTTRWQQGRFFDAQALHQRALDGYTKIRGPDHPDTLNTMSRLAGDHGKLLAFEEAIRLHSAAVAGLQTHRGAAHEDTLAATQSLGMAYVERFVHRKAQPSDLDDAYQIMQGVVQRRKSHSGKEHGLTLWAIADFARVKNARGEHEEAEAEFRAGLPVVEQNFGKDHIGTLYGKTYLGHVLLCRGKYGEAEALLIDVVDTHQRLRPNHPDQLVGLSFLLKCYSLTGREADAATIRSRIEVGLDAIGTRGHGWEKQLFDAWVPGDMVQMSPRKMSAQFEQEPRPYELLKRSTM